MDEEELLDRLGRLRKEPEPIPVEPRFSIRFMLFFMTAAASASGATLTGGDTNYLEFSFHVWLWLSGGLVLWWAAFLNWTEEQSLRTISLSALVLLNFLIILVINMTIWDT